MFRKIIFGIVFIAQVGVLQAADVAEPAIIPEEAAVAKEGVSILGFNIGRGGRPDRYVPNISNPLFNETPFITSEIRPIFIYHDIPESFPNVPGIEGGGNIIIGALQARLALSERLGFIATSDGYADANFDGLPDESGFVNVAVGLKYSVFQDLDKNAAVSAGLRYQIPVQELSTAGIEFQAAGAGFINPFITAATDLSDFGLDKAHVQASAGLNIAFDQDAETSLFHFSLGTNYELFDNFFPTFEVNGFVPIIDGERFTGPVLGELNGADLANFGSDSRDPSITLAGGARYRFTDNAIGGLAIEGQVTDRTSGLFNWRLTADLVLHF